MVKIGVVVVVAAIVADDVVAVGVADDVVDAGVGGAVVAIQD